MSSLNPQLFSKDVEQIPIRDGFGQGLVAAAQINQKIVGLCADLTESTRMEAFAKAFPERFVEVGVAEQNMVTVAAGMAAIGKIPFTSSYAAFSPGRNWEQIRTTIALNDANVKIVGNHAGVSVGPDGATHQMLEDIALMRTLPNMLVVVPCDALQAKLATLALADYRGPAYLRLAREKSPIITTDATGFSLKEAQVLRPGHDITLVACGSLVYEALSAAADLAKQGIEAEVINVPVIKPLDGQTILASLAKTRSVITIEEHQINGGLGSAIAELVVEHDPVPLQRIGLRDRFGESGEPNQLLEHFELTAPHIAKTVHTVLKRKK